MQVYKKILILFTIVAISAACNQKNDTRKAALEFFMGSNNKGGYMISSWADKKKDDIIRYRRIVLGLDESWQYWSEDIDIYDLGNYEYFIRYSVIFRNDKSREIFTREESFYSIGHEYWEPVRLMSYDFNVNLDSKKLKQREIKALWKGDFSN